MKFVFVCLLATSAFCYRAKVTPKQKKLSRRKRFLGWDPGKIETTSTDMLIDLSNQQL